MTVVTAPSRRMFVMPLVTRPESLNPKATPGTITRSSQPFTGAGTVPVTLG